MEMTAKSYIQTVEVKFPFSPNIFLTMKMAPPRIPFNSKEEEMKILWGNEMDIYWEPDGTIKIIHHEDDIVEFYHPKPTLKDIILQKGPQSGGYFRQHKNGAVEEKYKDYYYFWGPEEDVEWDKDKYIETIYDQNYYDEEYYEKFDYDSDFCY